MVVVVVVQDCALILQMMRYKDIFSFLLFFFKSIFVFESMIITMIIIIILPNSETANKNNDLITVFTAF